MDTYYLLLDSDTSKVSIAWKGIQLICLVTICISGFWAAFCMGRLTIDFGNNCFLYARLEFLTNDTDLEDMRLTYPLFADQLPAASAINLHTTQWGKKSMCYFCQFTPLMSSIYSLIWFAIFILCTRGGAGYISDIFSRPWRIVYPALIFGAISALVMFVSAIHITNGSQQFCYQFVKQWNSTSCFNDIDKYTIYFSGKKHNFFANLLASVTCSHICCVAWILYVLILGLRIICIADFNMVRVQVIHKTASKQCLIYPPSLTTQPKHVTLATPERISDDMQKEAETKRLLQKNRALAFEPEIDTKSRRTKEMIAKDWNYQTVNTSPCQSDFNLLDLEKNDAPFKKRVTIVEERLDALQRFKAKIRKDIRKPRESAAGPSGTQQYAKSFRGKLKPTFPAFRIPQAIPEEPGPLTPDRATAGRELFRGIDVIGSIQSIPSLTDTTARIPTPPRYTSTHTIIDMEPLLPAVSLRYPQLVSEEVGATAGTVNKGINTETTYGIKLPKITFFAFSSLVLMTLQIP